MFPVSFESMGRRGPKHRDNFRLRRGLPGEKKGKRIEPPFPHDLNGFMEKILLSIGALLGGISVATGAFGAHVMKGRYSEYALEIFEKAVRYEMYHALAMVLSVVLISQYGTPSRTLQLSPWFFLFGILFFSGSLYILAFTGIRILGAITPIGGVSFLMGWGLLAIGALTSR